MTLLRSCSLVLAGLLTACGDPLVPEGFLEVSVDIETDVVRHGDPTLVTVSVTNHGPETVSINGKGCPPKFQVLDARGDAVGPERRFCTMELRTLELSPGSTYTFSASWAGLGVEGGVHEPRPLPAGTYWLQGDLGLVRSPLREVRVEEAVEADG